MILFEVKTLIITLAVLLNFMLGFFIYFKNRFHPLNKNMALVGLLSGLMCLGQAFNYDLAEIVQDSQLSLCTGDKVVIYTDGVTEARNDRDDFYTLERLVRVVTEHGAQSVEDLIGLVRNDVHGFIGNQPQFADLTLVIMEVRQG